MLSEVTSATPTISASWSPSHSASRISTVLSSLSRLTHWPTSASLGETTDLPKTTPKATRAMTTKVTTMPMTIAAIARPRPLRCPFLVRERPTKPRITPTGARQHRKLSTSAAIETPSVLAGGGPPYPPPPPYGAP